MTRHCGNCGAAEGDLRQHFVVDTATGEIVHIVGIFKCGDLVEAGS